MVDRVLKAAEETEGGEMIDDNYEERRVRVGSSVERTLVKGDSDPFKKEAGEFKTMVGLSATTKKRAARFEKSHTGTGGAESKKNEGLRYKSGYDVLGVVEPPFNLSYLAKLYEASSAHYAAVNAKTANIVGLGFDFIESSKSKEKIDAMTSEEEKARVGKKLRKWRQSLFDWLDQCHEEDEFMETLRKVYIDYEVTGNGYFEIGRAKDGSVGYIGHIPAVSMRIRQKRDGFVQMSSDKTVFFKHFGSNTADPLGSGTPNEVIHIKKYSPTSSYYGVPDIVAATQAVAGIEFASRFNLDYFENKAVPRYVIVIKGGKMDSSSASSIVDFFETGLRGKNHRTLFVPLPADEPDRKASFEMKPVEAGTQDASFVNYNKINLQSIFMAHRVPMGKTGYIEGTALAAARDADKTFKESVCRPEQSVLEKKFGRVIQERTDAFYFKLNELTLTDEDTQSKIDERAIRNQWAVPNEIRARKGQSAIKGGDTIVDFKANQASENATTATGGRARDRARSAGATDSAGQGRNTKGEGRSTN
jgi:PBSX family phage portal protein